MAEDILEIIDTKITDKWGVHWNEMETVRDFLQNFYDDNSIEDINIIIENRTVKISAPKEFDYQELIYLGSDKGDNPESIGQYGEGWKASVLNSLRNFNCSVEIVINDKKLIFYFDDKKIGKTYKRVVHCKVIKIEAISGSMLIVGNCSNEMLNEFRFGLNYFYYNKNPLLGDVLASSWDNKVIFYKSTDNSGYIFYKRLLRSRLDAPIIIVCNNSYHHVEVKIKHDRDRKAFNDEVIDSLLKYVCKKIYEKKSIVSYMADYWKTGHKILYALSNTMSYRGESIIDFPEKYYAKDSTSKYQLDKNIELKIEVEKVIEEFKKNHLIPCPHYMSRFGMKTPTSYAENRIKQKLDKHIKHNSRELTLLEQNALNLILDFIKRYSKVLYQKCQDFQYIITDSQEIVVNLKKNKKFDDKRLFLNKTFFTYKFADSLVLLIKEFDDHLRTRSDQDFSDFYIALISSLIKEKEAIDNLKKYETEWIKLIEMIIEGADFIPIEANLQREKSSQISELRNLFIEGKIKELIEKLKIFDIEDLNIKDNFILLSEQYNTWLNDDLQGIDDNNQTRINKIKKGFLSILNQLEN